MGECSKCGKQAMTFTCRYCEKKFCSEHRLPENHDCEGLEEGVEKEKEETQKWFEEKKLKQETTHGQPKKPSSSLVKDIISGFKYNRGNRCLVRPAVRTRVFSTTSAFTRIDPVSCRCR